MAGPTQFKIFVGGPSDVGSDIEAVKHCIDEVNLLATPLGMRFATFYWGDDAVPGIGTEPQELINEQADGYDAFVAIFGAKLGSPTKKHASGTVEEVENAIARMQHLAFGKHSVAIFFRGIKLDTRHSDLASAVKVQEFRATLGPRGVLFKDYDSDQSLRDAVFRTFGVLIASHLKGTNLSTTSTPPPTTDEESPEENGAEDDLGIMDFETISQDNMAISNEYADKLSESIKDFGDTVSIFGDEIAAANLAGDRPRIRSILGKTAESMKEKSSEIDQISNILFDSYAIAMEAMKSIIDWTP